MECWRLQSCQKTNGHYTAGVLPPRCSPFITVVKWHRWLQRRVFGMRGWKPIHNKTSSPASAFSQSSDPNPECACGKVQAGFKEIAFSIREHIIYNYRVPHNYLYLRLEFQPTKAFEKFRYLRWDKR